MPFQLKVFYFDGVGETGITKAPVMESFECEEGNATSFGQRGISLSGLFGSTTGAGHVYHSSIASKSPSRSPSSPEKGKPNFRVMIQQNTIYYSPANFLLHLFTTEK